MKKLFSLLLALTLAVCLPARAEIDKNLFGEWFHYASSFEGVISTRANERVSTGFIIRRDGSVSFTRDSFSIDEGTWEWDDNNSIVSLTDSSGVTMMLVMINGMLHTVSHYSTFDSLEIYYRPGLYAASPAYFEERAWELTHFIDNGLSTRAADNKTDYRFLLHADGSAFLLINYQPVSGKWFTDQLNVIIESPNGTYMELEPQYDDSFFGTYFDPAGSSFQLEFDEIPPFEIAETHAALSDLSGEWRMTGMLDKHGACYPRETLTFDFILTLRQEGASLRYTTSSLDDTMTLASGISAGAVLTEEDTGTVLTLTRANGSQMVFWLKTDGSLHWKNPGDSTFIFEKIG